jgi:hypothetical protein
MCLFGHFAGQTSFRPRPIVRSFWTNSHLSGSFIIKFMMFVEDTMRRLALASLAAFGALALAAPASAGDLRVEGRRAGLGGCGFHAWRAGRGGWL